MTQPQSIKTDPYTDFPRQPYTIITDDFCHEKLLVIKPTLKTQKSVIKLKQTINSKKGKFGFADETKLWFDLPRGGSIYSKLKSSGELKLHYHDGITTIKGRPFFFYAGLNSNRALELLAVKLGIGHDSEHCHSDNRLKISDDKGTYKYHWYSRTMIYEGNFRFGLVTCLDLCNKVLQKSNLLFGYNIDANTQTFLRAEVDGWRTHNPDIHNLQSIWDKVTFDFVRKINDRTTAALQVGYSIKNKTFNNVQAVVQHQTQGKETVKIGVNQNFDISLLVKRPQAWRNWFDNFATVSAGFNITGLTQKSFGVKTGFQIALNL